MKTSIFILFVFFGPFGLLCQIADNPFSPRTKRFEENLIANKVKKETMFVHKVKSNGKVRRKGTLRNETIYNIQGKSLRSSTYFPDMTLINISEYDENGNFIKLVSYDGSGKVRTYFINELDENGKLLRTIYFKPDGTMSSVKEENKKTEGKFTINYNNKGEVISKTENTYDSLQRLYISRLLSPTDELKYENKFLMNGNSQVIELRVIDNIQNKKFIEKYTYDEHGNIIELIKTDNDGNPISKFENQYNSKNLKIESTWFEPIKTKKQVSRYIYEFY